jgi:hypothetical protein
MDDDSSRGTAHSVFLRKQQLQQRLDDDSSYVSTASDERSQSDASISLKKETIVKSGVYSIKRRKDMRTVRVYLYNTAEHRNAPIVNAVTGIQYRSEEEDVWNPNSYIPNPKIGSAQEDSLFKVKFVTRENKLPGLLLFYDSPEQYERHTESTLCEKIKKYWHDKRAGYSLKNIARVTRPK